MGRPFAALQFGNLRLQFGNAAPRLPQRVVVALVLAILLRISLHRVLVCHMLHTPQAICLLKKLYHALYYMEQRVRALHHSRSHGIMSQMRR
jgi:hypothetical protein